MKYYTESIPATLAEKLKEKGMPIEMQPLYAQEAPNARGIVQAGVGLWCPNYAECFDWLMEKEIILYLDAKFHRWFWRIESKEHGFEETEEFEDWHEAANAAIEKALELI